MTTHEHTHDHEHQQHEHHQEGWSYCEVHPDRETALRCNKCERFMCTECAVQTPVGYRCRECVREQEDKYFSNADTDYVVIAAVCFVGGFIGSFIVALIPFLLFTILLSIPIGGAIGDAGLRAVKRRRGRYSDRVATGAMVVGGLAPLFLGLFGGGLITLLYVGFAGSAVYGRFQMRI